jgi:hypothetical protein
MRHPGAGQTRQPGPDLTAQFSLKPSFAKSRVGRDEVIDALENILRELRRKQPESAASHQRPIATNTPEMFKGLQLGGNRDDRGGPRLESAGRLERTMIRTKSQGLFPRARLRR